MRSDLLQRVCRGPWAPLLANLVLGTSLLAAGAPAKPNIVLLLADDLGFSDLGC